MQDGRTTRQHLEAYAERDPIGGAIELAAVTPEPLPVCAAHAAAAFEALSATRGHGLTGPRPIGFADLQHYTTLVAPLAPREVSWLLTMDRAYCSAAAEALARG